MWIVCLKTYKKRRYYKNVKMAVKKGETDMEENNIEDVNIQDLRKYEEEGEE